MGLGGFLASEIFWVVYVVLRARLCKGRRAIVSHMQPHAAMYFANFALGRVPQYHAL